MKRFLALLLCAALLAPDLARAGGHQINSGQAAQSGTPVVAPVNTADLQIQSLSTPAPLPTFDVISPVAPDSPLPPAPPAEVAAAQAAGAAGPIVDVSGAASVIPTAPPVTDHAGVHDESTSKNSHQGQDNPAADTTLGQVAAIIGDGDQNRINERIRRYFEMDAQRRQEILAAVMREPVRVQLNPSQEDGAREGDKPQQIQAWRQRAKTNPPITSPVHMAGWLAMIGVSSIAAGLALMILFGFTRPLALVAFAAPVFAAQIFVFWPEIRRFLAHRQAERVLRERKARILSLTESLKAGGERALSSVQGLRDVYSEEGVDYDSRRAVVEALRTALDEDPAPQARRALVAALEGIARAPQKEEDGNYLFTRATGALVQHVNKLRPGRPPQGFEKLQEHWPSFLSFTALSDYLADVRDAEAAAALSGLSPAARITLEVDSYDRLRRGASTASVRARLLLKAKAQQAREARLKSWKPTIGIELEVFGRTLGVAQQDQHQAEHAWSRSAHEFAGIFGIRTATDQMIEYAPDPGFEWRSLDELTLALRRAELMPPSSGDYAKLHISVVHARPDSVSFDMREWRRNTIMIGLLQGALTASDRRMGERIHSSPFRETLGFKSDKDFINIGGLSQDSFVRAQYLTGNASVDPLGRDESPESDHRRALRMVDTLNTGLYAYVMDSLDPSRRIAGAGAKAVMLFWREDAEKKHRLAGLYREFARNIEIILEQRGYGDMLDELLAMRASRDYVANLREDRETLRRLERVVDVYIPLMDRIIDGLASQPATADAGGAATAAPH